METTITEHKTIGLRDLEAAWILYEHTFAPLAAIAVQRHVMTFKEFAEVMADPRLGKWVVTDDDSGDMVAMGVQTTELDAWPLISPAYFQAKWPGLYAASRIWYVGFVCVRHPEAPPMTFARLITAMSAPTRAVGGISVMDFCNYNVDDLHIDRAAGMALRRADPGARGEEIDAQRFYAFHFTPVTDPARLAAAGARTGHFAA